MSEPAWLVDVRDRVHADPELQRRLLAITDPDEFAQQLVVLAGPPLTLDDIAQASREERRHWLERWIA